MKLGRYFWILAVVVQFISGCGTSFVILEVHSDLQIPNQTDSIIVMTLDANQPDIVLGDAEFVLESGIWQ